tara:strand:- start:666 stop:926 length:261 start_codon:yes stop_codon:yes gene_type:complete
MSNLLQMTKDELKNHIFNLQNIVQEKLSTGIDIDDFLDETDIFNEFENIIPDEEFPIFVIAILNNYKSDIIIDKLVDSIFSINDMK